MAEIVAIADAVVETLNAGKFRQAFTARRYYRPVFDLAQMHELHVSVVPKAIEASPGTRSQTQRDYAIDVAVQKKVAKAEGEASAEIDALMGLVEETADHLRFKRLEGYPVAAWVRTQNDPIYAAEHLEQMRQFTSVLTVTYRVLR